MKVRFKKLVPEAVAPYQATDGSAGWDLTATSKELIQGKKAIYGTGLSVEIPKGYVGLLFPRSSIHKKALRLSNSVGVIDSDYRGEIKAVFDRLSTWPYEWEIYQTGDRICQLIILPVPTIEWEESEDLTNTERGSGGYGSTGR